MKEVIDMAEFESCEKCKYNSKAETEYPCNRCVHNATDKFEPITNADKIRSMSDEELAEFINFGSPDCSRHCADFKPGCSFSCNHNHGNDVILKWLQSEAEMEK